jgi:hypothetical protein
MKTSSQLREIILKKKSEEYTSERQGYQKQSKPKELILKETQEV